VPRHANPDQLMEIIYGPEGKDFYKSAQNPIFSKYLIPYTNTPVMTIAETERLLIKPLTIADAPFILVLTNSPGWLEFIGDRGIRNLTDAENYITKGPMASYAKFGHGLYLVVLKETGSSIGICGLLQRDTLPDKDIGFSFLPEYTGKGYALEAAAAVLLQAKASLGITRILAITLPANTRSIQLLTKLGLVFEKMVQFPGDKEELMLFGMG
jgi:[ribosomal protein S5]-alanine N-acetyltransferase